MAYWDNKTGIGKVYLRASTDKGQTFRPEITLTDPADYPKISAQTKAQFEKLSPYEMKTRQEETMSTLSLVELKALTN